MRLCPHCQSANPDQTDHCIKCGVLLVAPGAEETQAQVDSHSSAKPDPRDELAAVTLLTPPGNRPSARASAPDEDNSATATAALEEQFGSRYRVICKLGEGGMGTVYKAYDRDLNRIVALKVVRPSLTTNPEAVQRFKQELLLASKISHKNILRIHDLGDHDGTKFISMAYVEGQDLYRILQQQGRLPVGRAVHIACQLCSALDAAEAEGVVHRDLKPQNILCDQAGNVYVSDFGLAKSFESDVGITRTAQLLGTPRYMSPEQAEAKPVDQRSDIYSLGLILYEMVTGDVPFHADSPLQLLYQRVQQKPKDPKLLAPELPEYLSRIILKCLETNPRRPLPARPRGPPRFRGRKCAPSSAQHANYSAIAFSTGLAHHQRRGRGHDPCRREYSSGTPVRVPPRNGVAGGRHPLSAGGTICGGIAVHYHRRRSELAWLCVGWPGRSALSKALSTP